MTSNIFQFNCNRYFSSPVYENRKLAQHASSLLSFYLSSNLVGLITLMDTILLSVGGSYRVAVQVNISEKWGSQALLVFKVLNKLCLLNLNQVQEWLASHDQLTELFHLMLFWLHYFSTQNEPKSLFPLIDELTILIGNVS
jgi:hypothetical protein